MFHSRKRKKEKRKWIRKGKKREKKSRMKIKSIRIGYTSMKYPFEA